MLIPVKLSKFHFIQPVEVKKIGEAQMIFTTSYAVHTVNFKEAGLLVEAYIAACNSNKRMFDVEAFIANSSIPESEETD